MPDFLGKVRRTVAGQKIADLSDIDGAGSAASKDTGTEEGKVPLLGEDGKLAVAVIDTGTEEGKVPLLGEDGKLAVAVIDTGTEEGKVPVIGADDKLPAAILPIVDSIDDPAYWE